MLNVQIEKELVVNWYHVPKSTREFLLEISCRETKEVSNIFDGYRINPNSGFMLDSGHKELIYLCFLAETQDCEWLVLSETGRSFSLNIPFFYEEEDEDSEEDLEEELEEDLTAKNITGGQVAGYVAGDMIAGDKITRGKK